MPRQRQTLPVKSGKKSPASKEGTPGKSKTARSRKKEKVKVGARSGARFRPAKVSNDEEGRENMEEFFKAHEEQSTPHAEKSTEARGGVLKTGKLNSKKPKPKTPKKKVRMSVGSDDDGTVESDKKMPAARKKSRDEESSQEDSLNNEDAERLTQDYVKKLKSTSLTSPSELSKVSTAPPTPFEEQEKTRFAKEDEDEEEDEQVDTGAPPAEDGLLTQPTHEDEEIVLPQAANGDRKQPAVLDRPKSPEAEYPEMGIEEDENNDLAPPEHSDNDDNSFGLEPPDHSDDEPDMQEDKKNALNKQGSDSDSDESGEGERPAAPAAAAAGTSDSGGSDSDSDKEGAGYNMVHDPETPASLRKKRAKEERVALIKKREKERKKKKRRGSDDSETDDESSTMRTPAPKQTKKKKKKRNVVFSPQGVPIANRAYERKPLDDFVPFDSDDENNNGVRRSRRAKVKPLQYWKNERLEYGANNETGVLGEVLGDMPVVVGVIKAAKTPYKKRKPVARKQADPTPKKKRRKQDEEEDRPYDLTKVKKKYKVMDGEVAFLWDDLVDDPGDMKVIAYAEGLQGTDLPLSQDRNEKEGFVVGKAAQAFNIPNHDSENYVGYIMGNLRLPPKGVKDPESVGPCSQTFTVCDCQPKALEIAYGNPDLPEGTLDPDTAQRFYLSPGDLFRVPPGNCYRLQNRSKTKEAVLTWTIIRPRNVANDDSSSED